jgi:hypothetical protein
MDCPKAGVIVSCGIDGSVGWASGVDAARGYQSKRCLLEVLWWRLGRLGSCQDMSVFVVCLRRETQAPAPVLVSSMGTGIDGFYVVAFVGFVVVRVYGVVPCFWK